MSGGKKRVGSGPVRFAKQLDKETWGFEDPSIKGTFVWSRSAGQGKFEWGSSQTTVHDGSAGGSTTPPTPIPEPRSIWGLPNPAPESLPPVPGTPIPEEQEPNIETLPIEDRDFDDFIIVDPMGVSRQSMCILRKPLWKSMRLTIMKILKAVQGRENIKSIIFHLEMRFVYI